MAISLVAVGAKITAAITNAIIGAVNAQGLTSVIPTSVAGTGVSVGAAGKVTLTAATSASVNGCFTSTYDQYLIAFDIPTIATAANLQLRLRAAGTDLSTATYVYGGTTNNTTATGVGSNGTTTAFYLTRDPVGSASASGEVLLFSPQLTVAKRLLSKFATANATYVTGDTVGGYQGSTASHDGFTLMNDGGVAMTGTIRIYGRNNN